MQVARAKHLYNWIYMNDLCYERKRAQKVGKKMLKTRK